MQRSVHKEIQRSVMLTYVSDCYSSSYSALSVSALYSNVNKHEYCVYEVRLRYIADTDDWITASILVERHISILAAALIVFLGKNE
jgi:hypothetical protein